MAGLSLPSLWNSIPSLTCPAGRQTFLEATVGELMNHVNKVNLVPGHFRLGAPPSLPCCPCLIHWSGRPASASTSCCHTAIFNLGCWLHPLTKLDLPYVRVKVTADSSWFHMEASYVGWSQSLGGAPSENFFRPSWPTWQAGLKFGGPKFVFFSEAVW